MPHIPELRSIYQRIGRIVHFGRMLDKIRLHAAGRLPADYVGNLGIGFDGRCCEFLGVDYTKLKERTLAGGTDEGILAWVEETCGARTDSACITWNGFMMKRGWRDDLTPKLRQRVKEAGLEDKPIETMFDFIEFDEGRDPVTNRSWEQ